MAGSTTGRRRTHARAVYLLALAALGVVLAAPVRAEPEPAKPLPDRARAVLEAHCAECREAHGGGNALDLDALADDLRYVVPRRPDASRIYQRLLASRASPMDDSASASALTPAEIETVRDWIDSLPARDDACRGRTRLTRAEGNALIESWVATRDTAEVTNTRILSLLHLWNACVTSERMKEARDAAAILLGALARRRQPLETETLGEASAILAVRLSKLALLPAEWDRLTASAPTSASADAVPADWLAAQILARPKDASGNVDPAFDVQFDAVGQRAVEKLARAWSQDVDLVRAAAERGVTPRALAETLVAVGGEFMQPARRLAHGSLTRSAWESLSRAIDGEAKPGSAESGAHARDAEIDVLVWTDKPLYRPRDLATINVSVGKACHLTLIDVDRDGKAIVLFPNEMEQDNLIAPSVTVRIPGNDAGYQFRFDRAGEEQIVAICQRKSRRLAGVAYDYERQRFAILGDWRTFLRTIPEREKKIRDREAAEAARRKRRGRPPAANGPPAIGAEEPLAIEGRAAITVAIEPRMTP